jgi:hypothetical protein
MKDLYASRREAPSLTPQISIVHRAIDRLEPGPASLCRHSKKRIRNTINALGFDARTRCYRDGDVMAGRRRPAAGGLRMTERARLRFDHLAPARARHAAIGRALNDLGAGVEAVHAV